MLSELERAKLLLSNCAYWSMTALGCKEGSPEHISKHRQICLENILEVAREFAVDLDTDSTVILNGINASLIPLEGWPSPVIERME